MLGSDSLFQCLSRKVFLPLWFLGPRALGELGWQHLLLCVAFLNSTPLPSHVWPRLFQGSGLAFTMGGQLLIPPSVVVTWIAH